MEKWTSKVQFPTDNFQVRCIDEAFGPSNAGKPMITLKFEVVSPESATVAGKEYNIAGVETQPYYAVTKSLNPDGTEDLEKSAVLKERTLDLYSKFGLPAPENLENPTLGFKGKTVWVLMQSETRERRKAPTADQLAKGVRQGDVICNPITGQPLVNYYPKVSEIFGVVQ